MHLQLYLVVIFPFAWICSTVISHGTRDVIPGLFHASEATDAFQFPAVDIAGICECVVELVPAGAAPGMITGAGIFIAARRIPDGGWNDYGGKSI